MLAENRIHQNDVFYGLESMLAAERLKLLIDRFRSGAATRFRAEPPARLQRLSAGYCTDISMRKENGEFATFLFTLKWVLSGDKINEYSIQMAFGSTHVITSKHVFHFVPK
jgi:hypothetical protein